MLGFHEIRSSSMSFDRNKQLSKKEIDSMNIAVNDTDIRSIHPDKMEEFAEHLVRKLKEEKLNETRGDQSNKHNEDV